MILNLSILFLILDCCAARDVESGQIRKDTTTKYLAARRNGDMGLNSETLTFIVPKADVTGEMMWPK